MAAELLEWWPVLVGVVAVIMAIGSHREKIKVLEEKVTELFKLWNGRNDG